MTVLWCSMTQRMSVLGATLTCEVKALMTITLVFISSQATHTGKTKGLHANQGVLVFTITTRFLIERMITLFKNIPYVAIFHSSKNYNTQNQTDRRARSVFKAYNFFIFLNSKKKYSNSDWTTGLKPKDCGIAFIVAWSNRSRRLKIGSFFCPLDNTLASNVYTEKKPAEKSFLCTIYLKHIHSTVRIAV